MTPPPAQHDPCPVDSDAAPYGPQQHNTLDQASSDSVPSASPAAQASPRDHGADQPSAAGPANIVEQIGLVPPAQGPDPYAHRRGEPRTFAALWVMYLFAAIALALSGLGWWGLSSPDVYRASARVLLVVLATSVWVVWPVVRLSQDRPRSVLSSVMTDWALVTAPAIGAVLPQALPWMAGWPLEVCVTLMGWLAGWALIAAGVLLWTFAGEPTDSSAPPPVRGLLRSCVMGGFMLVLLVPGGLVLLGQRASDQALTTTTQALLYASPASGMWLLTAPRAWEGRTAAIEPLGWTALACIGGVGALLVATGALRARAAARPNASSSSSDVQPPPP